MPYKSYKISDEVLQFFDELKNTNQIKSYHHSFDDEYAEILVITFNSEKTITIRNWGIEYNCPLEFDI
jgi:hypothetical protein